MMVVGKEWREAGDRYPMIIVEGKEVAEESLVFIFWLQCFRSWRQSHVKHPPRNYLRIPR